MDELELKEKKERKDIEGRPQAPKTEDPGVNVDVDLEELEEALSYTED